MWISTKGKNAVKVMIDLGMYATGDPIKVKDIARRQDISEKYLEQIISVLSKTGLVRSVRGAKGGYILNGSPEKVTVRMILEAAEGDISVTDNSSSDMSVNITDMVSNKLWDELNAAVGSVIDRVTLADMLEWEQNLLVDQYTI